MSVKTIKNQLQSIAHWS